MTSRPTSAVNPRHVETCGAHLPRLTSDAYTFEQPTTSAISHAVGFVLKPTPLDPAEVAGHSPRAGLATSAAAAGVPE